LSAFALTTRSTAPTGERSAAGSAASAPSLASSAAAAPASVVGSWPIRRAYSGSRSFQIVNSGAAMKIDE